MAKAIAALGYGCSGLVSWERSPEAVERFWSGEPRNAPLLKDRARGGAGVFHTSPPRCPLGIQLSGLFFFCFVLGYPLLVFLLQVVVGTLCCRLCTTAPQLVPPGAARFERVTPDPRCF
ncbi:hypothetical protein NDU88_009826 [Pleurodeles waltl]|uniref:Uncharacterized protein n=1 Tax=Pleurodeles waltl TaxID=8319 RepID=A0AAV7PTX7_PLEWA|nr:hypothetical protein NDU88_009826 [Pleurodeles waltl]